jgi:hypothetical protein
MMDRHPSPVNHGGAETENPPGCLTLRYTDWPGHMGGDFLDGIIDVTVKPPS